MNAVVYILKDDLGNLYIGSTNDIDRRFKQHLSGHTSTTNRYKNPKIVLTQECPSLKEARKVELKLKKLKRKDYLNKIIDDGYIKIKV